MGMSVTLLCTFRVSHAWHEFAQMASTAAAQIPQLPEDDRDSDAEGMLRYAAAGHGLAEGRNGDMFSWGIVGNYSDWQRFLACVAPFFVSCWNSGHLARSSHVVIFEQGQDQVHLRAIEVRLSSDAAHAMKHRPVTEDDLLIHSRDLGMPIFGDFEGVPAVYRSPRLDTEPKLHLHRRRD